MANPASSAGVTYSCLLNLLVEPEGATDVQKMYSP
jgi:hypothetical protein